MTYWFQLPLQTIPFYGFNAKFEFHYEGMKSLGH